MAEILKPVDETGRELDARFSVELCPSGFDLIVESRGGSEIGATARNTDYAPGIELHLRRMQALGMELQELHVASSIAMAMPEADRRVSLVEFPLPLNLALVADLTELRHSIGRASSTFGRPDGKDRGNRTKRMRLRMSWPAAVDMTTDDIGKMLAHPVSAMLPTEAPTADPEALEQRVERAAARLRAAARSGTVPPPPGQTIVAKTSGLSSRFVRDPNVIAWVLHTAAGHCEKCRLPAPFTRVDGEPFLEVHHVCSLGEGGPDTTDNAIACCPNCHRQLHYDLNKAKLRRDVIASLGRLRDFSAVP